MSDLTLRVENGEGVVRVITGTKQELRRALGAAGNRLGARFLTKFRRERLRGPPGVKSSPGRRGLSARFAYRIDGLNSRSSDLVLHIGTGSRAAVQQQFGGKIAPQRGRQLAVPFSSLTRSQILKARAKLDETKQAFLARQLGLNLFTSTTGRGDKKRKLKRARQLKETTFVVRGKDGRGYLAEALRDPPRGWGQKRVRLFFHFQPSIVLEPRLNFFELWRDYAPVAKRIFGDAVFFALRAARASTRRR